MTSPRIFAGFLLPILAAAAVLSACEPHKSTAPINATPPESIAGRVRVLSADVLIIDNRHVRLVNAYAPETLTRTRCWAEALASDHAAEYVRDLVSHARTIDFKPNGKTDEYNRDIGAVTIDGADLGDILYEQGLAARPVEPRFDWCQPISKQADGAPKISTLLTPN
jgi:endonuclease YncB( thermonuclease family)